MMGSIIITVCVWFIFVCEYIQTDLAFTSAQLNSHHHHTPINTTPPPINDNYKVSHFNSKSSQFIYNYRSKVKIKQITHNFLSIKIKDKTNYSRLNWTSALLILPVFFSIWLWSNRSCNIWCHNISPIIMFQLAWLGLSVETITW